MHLRLRLGLRLGLGLRAAQQDLLLHRSGCRFPEFYQPYWAPTRAATEPAGGESPRVWRRRAPRATASASMRGMTVFGAALVALLL